MPTMTLAVASNGRGKAFGDAAVAAATVSTASASRTTSSNRKASAATRWMNCWDKSVSGEDRGLVRERPDLVRDVLQLLGMLVEVLATKFALQGPVRCLQERDVLAQVLDALVHVVARLLLPRLGPGRAAPF